MGEFSTVLKESRELSNLYRHQLSKMIGKSESYISALEDSKGGKKPSIETLRKIVYVLSYKGKEGLKTFEECDAKEVDWREADARLALKLILSALDIEVEKLWGLPFIKPKDELEEQQKLEEGSEVWVISDLLFEAMAREYAEVTAKNIKERKIKYVYFVPTYVENSHWDRAIRYIRESIGECREQVDKFVSVYNISKCAFSCRIRISNPRGVAPTANYSLAASVSQEYLLYPAPAELVTMVVRTLGELIHLEEQETKEWAGPREIGAIRRLYPKRKVK